MALLLLAMSGTTEAGGESFRFAVFGDTRYSGPMFPTLPRPLKKIVEEVGLIAPDFVVHTGDMIFGYGESDARVEEEFDEALGLFRSLPCKVYFTPGNHDYATPYAARRFHHMTGQPPFFSFDYQDAHFIVLNTEVFTADGSINPPQMQWLRDDLEGRKGSRAVFVFMHRPMFAVEDQNAGKPGPGGSDRNPGEDSKEKGRAPRISPKTTEMLADLFARYEVKAVFSAHENLFHRTEVKGVKYLTIGGGGAEMRVSPEQGGFWHYLLVKVEGSDVRMDLIEPYHIFSNLSYIQDSNKVTAEARIYNLNYIDRLPLKGIKFTVPAGDYSLKADTIPSQELITQGGEKKWGPETIQASILKKVDSMSEKGKIDIYTQVDLPQGYSLLLTLTPQ